MKKQELNTREDRSLKIINEVAGFKQQINVPTGLAIPGRGRVYVKECTQEEHKTQGGIILSASSSLQHAKIGIIYRVGPGVDEMYDVGHKVSFDKHANFGFVHNGVPYLSIMEHELHGVWPPGNYMMPHVPDTEEIRRGDRIDATSRIHKESEKKMDEINNS